MDTDVDVDVDVDTGIDVDSDGDVDIDVDVAVDVDVDVRAKEMTSIWLLKGCRWGVQKSQILGLFSVSRVSFCILLNIFIENT